MFRYTNPDVSLPTANASSLSVRVYYEDTDASGVVYHAGYLRFFERARTEWLRQLGFSQHSLAAELGVAFTLTHVEVEFRRPARLDDLLEISADVREVRRASFAFAQSAHRTATGELLANAQTRVACVQVASFKPCGIPDALRQRMQVSGPLL